MAAMTTKLVNSCNILSPMVDVRTPTCLIPNILAANSDP